MSRKRPKRMSWSEFNKFVSDNTRPFRFDVENRPEWAKGIPHEKLHSGFASGSLAPNDEEANIDGQIGGIDIFRHAEPEDGVNLNKDHYYVVKDPDDPENLFVFGPYHEDPNTTNDEHHIDNLPDRLKKAKFVDS